MSQSIDEAVRAVVRAEVESGLGDLDLRIEAVVRRVLAGLVSGSGDRSAPVAPGATKSGSEGQGRGDMSSQRAARGTPGPALLAARFPVPARRAPRGAKKVPAADAKIPSVGDEVRIKVGRGFATGVVVDWTGRKAVVEYTNPKGVVSRAERGPELLEYR